MLVVFVGKISQQTNVPQADQVKSIIMPLLSILRLAI